MSQQSTADVSQARGAGQVEGAGGDGKVEASGEVAERVVEAILAGTDRRVRNLRVEVDPHQVLLRGECASFHCKQLAQHAARQVIGTARLTNQIQVN